LRSTPAGVMHRLPIRSWTLCPSEAQAFIRQFLSRLETATPEEIEQAMGNIRQNMAQAPAQMQGALEVLLKRLEAKLKSIRPQEEIQ